MITLDWLRVGGWSSTSTSLGLTNRNILKLLSWQFLGQRTNKKLNHIRILVSLHSSDGDPKEQLFGLNPRNTGHGAIAKLSRDFLVIVNQLVKLDVTWARELESESSIIRESEGVDVVWDETLWEAIVLEEVMDICGCFCDCDGGWKVIDTGFWESDGEREMGLWEKGEEE